MRNQRQSRWLHGWAVLTVCVTLPLLLLGAEVTTKQVGMVDPQGFRPPWHMLTVSLRERGLGFVIEHSHRLAGFVVGTCIIVLAAGLWFGERRRWLRGMGLVVLAAVIVQGLLGGFRVQLNALVGPNLALVHGCFAQLVFALLVSVALFTSRGWGEAARADQPPVAPGGWSSGSSRGNRRPAEAGTPAPPLAPAGEGAALRRWSVVTACLVYAQILFGAVVRHTENPLGPRLHLLGAFAVAAAVAWLGRLTLEHRPRDRALTGAAAVLGGLVGLQLLLGVETWLAKFAAGPEWPQLRPLTVHPELIRSVHYLVGSLVLAAAVVVALQAHRRTAWAVHLNAAPAERLEGAL